MKLFLLPLLLLTLCFSVFGQSKTPKFADYPVKEIYKGKTAPVVIAAKDRAFRTRLRWAGKNQEVNFAGRYILTFWGCGTSCIMGAVIDARTGLVYDWGFSTAGLLEDQSELVRFEKNSRLIIFHGLRNEKEGDNGDHYYKFDGRRFVHLKTVLSSYQ